MCSVEREAVWTSGSQGKLRAIHPFRTDAERALHWLVYRQGPKEVQHRKAGRVSNGHMTTESTMHNRTHLRRTRVQML